jgi:hypothetical protein
MHTMIPTRTHMHDTHYVHVCACVYVCMYDLYVSTMSTCVCMYIHLYVCMYVCVCAHAYINIHTYTYMHTYMAVRTAFSYACLYGSHSFMSHSFHAFSLFGVRTHRHLSLLAAVHLRKSTIHSYADTLAHTHTHAH